MRKAKGIHPGGDPDEAAPGSRPAGPVQPLHRLLHQRLSFAPSLRESPTGLPVSSLGPTVDKLRFIPEGL